MIEDGDTFQLGTGTVSAGLAPFLSHRRDLGVHSELIFGGIPALVDAGVVTGARKTVHAGKIVGASFGPLSAEEFAAVDGDMRYELYCMSHTNDIQVIAAHENMCAVNNALFVDATGQINGETIGPRIYSGTGGAFAFAIGAMHAKNGRSVTVLPSTSVVDGERRSRIVRDDADGQRGDGAARVRGHHRHGVRHRAGARSDAAAADRGDHRDCAPGFPGGASGGGAGGVRGVRRSGKREARRGKRHGRQLRDRGACEMMAAEIGGDAWPRL